MKASAMLFGPFIIAAALAASVADADGTMARFEGKTPFATVTKDVQLGGPRVRLDFFARHDRQAGQTAYVVSGAFTAQLTGESSLRWATTKDCPGLRERMAALAALRGPRPLVPGLDQKPPALTTDGAIYQLRARSTRFGDGGTDGYDMTMSSNLDTPLAEWTDGTLAALKACWRDTPPSFQPRSP